MIKKIITIIVLLFVQTGIVNAQTEQVANYVSAGVTLHDKGDYNGAIENFEKALEIDKKSALANYEMANTYIALKDYKKAIKYADKVIDGKGDFVDNAFVLKGTAQDLMGEPKEAIKTYKKGIKKSPQNYLLHYNLALTAYSIKDYETAEEGATGAIQQNPNHGSSHFLLAFIMNAQGKRVQTLLSIYYFLLIEPNTARTTDALTLLDNKLKQGVKKTGENSISISIGSLDNKNDEFSSAELMLSMLEATKNIEENLNKSEEDMFCQNTASFFKMLGELKKDKKGFWWDFYVTFFNDMALAKHTDAFCYYIIQSKEKGTIEQWFEENKDKLNAFSDWYGAYGTTTED
jgi:tetratricopeptide (TPR) repeat protein